MRAIEVDTLSVVKDVFFSRKMIAECNASGHFFQCISGNKTILAMPVLKHTGSKIKKEVKKEIKPRNL